MISSEEKLGSRLPAHVTITGDGKPVIFVHGNASTREIWRDVTRSLAKQFRCISYDLRGHGAGPAFEGTATLDRLVADLESLRETLALDEPVGVVGQSLGAFVTAAYAVRHAGRVSWVGLLAMPANRTQSDRKAARLLIKRLQKDGVAATAPDLVKLWYTDAFAAVHHAHLQKRLDQMLALDEKTFLAFYELYCRVDVDALLPRIKAPALVMTGQYARGAGEHVARHIAGKLPNGKLQIFPELKNGLMTEIPERVAAELARFADLFP